jgi:flagellar biogenesis protein FliO
MSRKFILWTIVALTFALGCAVAQVPAQPPVLTAEPSQPGPDVTAAKPQTPASTDQADTLPPPPDISIIKVASGMGLVLFLIIGGFMGGKKLFPQFFNRTTGEKSLKVLETLTMGDKRSISVVEFEGQRYMVGNTSHQITLLATLSSRSYISDELAEPSQPFNFAKNKPATNSFRNIYEKERTAPVKGAGRPIPPDIRAKMRQLRESLEMPKA